MRFCTSKNTVLILSALLCQIFLSYFVSWQSAVGAQSASISGEATDSGHDSGLHISTGPANIFLEGKKQNTSSGKMAQRVLELISFFTRHINECAPGSVSEQCKINKSCSFWLIYCSIRR
ncbi:hypothetical protein KA183_19900 [bacterium]|nr:hypothetical protein [bacterium]